MPADTADAVRQSVLPAPGVVDNSGEPPLLIPNTDAGWPDDMSTIDASPVQQSAASAGSGQEIGDDPFRSPNNFYGHHFTQKGVVFNEATGHARHVMSPIGVDELSIRPVIRIGEHGLFETLNLNYANGSFSDFHPMGFSVQMHAGYIAVGYDYRAPGQPLSFHPPFRLVDSEGGVTAFHLDYLFQQPVVDYDGTGEIPVNFLDHTTMSRISRDPGVNHTRSRFYLLRPDGTKITLAPKRWVPDTSLSEFHVYPMTYWPVSIEKPNGRVLHITYARPVDTASADPAYDLVPNKITGISDDEGRSLIFKYFSAGMHTGFLEKIELHVAGNDPETLAQLAYHDSYPLLQSIRDGEGYLTLFGYTQTPGRWLLTSIVNQQAGVTYLNWLQGGEVYRLTSLAFGKAGGNQMDELHVFFYDSNIQERTRVTSIRSYGSGAIRSETQYSPTFPTQILETNSVYRDGPTYLEGDPDNAGRFAGSLIYRETTEYRAPTPFKSTWVVEAEGRSRERASYEYDLTGLWTTNFVPNPHYAFDPQWNGQDVDAGWNYLRYPRLRRIVIEEPAVDRIMGLPDKAYLGTVFHYQFNQPYGNTGTADLSGAVVQPNKIVNLVYVDETLQSQYEDYHVRELTFSNRVEKNHPANTPIGQFEYAIPLLTGTLTYYTDNGTERRIAGKRETQYHPTYPFPSLVRLFADDSSSVDTYYTYYPPGSGADSGLLHKEYTDSLSNATIYEDYQWGVPRRTRKPGRAVTEVLARDLHGNNTEIREDGVVYRSEYDKLNRIVRADYPEDPATAATVTEYAPYLSPDGNYLASYRDAATPRFSTRVDFDHWNREIGSVSDITAGPGGIKAVTGKTYDGLGRLRVEETAAGATTHTYADLVWDRDGATATEDPSGADLRRSQRTVTRFDDGFRAEFLFSWIQGSTVPANQNLRVDEVLVKDFSGREVLAGTNILTQDLASTLSSTDYRLGGITTILHEYEDNTQRWRRTVKPYHDQNNPSPDRWRTVWRDWLNRVTRIDDPEQGTVEMSYNGRGLLAYVTEGDGARFRFLYDDAGRLIEARKRTQIDPDLYELLVGGTSYHPVHGFAQEQIRKTGPDTTRVITRAEAPDTLGRPTRRTVIVPEPVFWDPVLRRTESTGSQGETWLCTWDALGRGSLATEYLLELRPHDGSRAPLFFANIQAAHPHAPLVEFTIDNAGIRAAVDAQLTGGPDHALWLADADAGTSANTVLDPEQRYRYRVTAIDDNYQPSRPSAWWADLPDLFIDNLDVALRNNGALVDIDLRVFNGGAFAAPPSLTRVYLSETFELTANLNPAASFATPAIEPGFAALHSIADLPVNDNQYVIVTVDADTQIEEQNENNNLAREFLAYQGDPVPDRPDLTVEELVYAFIYLAGTGRYDVYATYSILNDSTVATQDDGSGRDGRSLTNLYFSSDNIVTGDDDLLAEPEVAPLQPGEREIQTTFLGNLDNPVPLHQTRLLAQANAGLDDVPRVDEGGNDFNNVGAIELPQADATGPDLRISGFVHHGLTGGPGNGSLNVTYSVENSGVWPAARSHVGFYVSTDRDFDEEDTRLTIAGGGDSMPVGIVHPSPRDRVTQSATLVIPDAFFSQENYLIVVADIDAEVVERVENNNARGHTFAGFPDLTVSELSYEPVEGVLSFTVRNEDQLASEPASAQIFIDFEEDYLPFRSTGLDTLPIPALTSGQSVSLSTGPGWAPPPSNRGQYLFAVADPDNELLERDEDNNVSPVPILIEAAGLPDDKPDLLPGDWGFTDDIWPAPKVLTAPDIEISEVRGVTGLRQRGNFQSRVFYRLRVAPDGPIDVRVSLGLSDDPVFSDDEILAGPMFTYTEETDRVIGWGLMDPDPPNYIMIRAEHVPGETKSTNNRMDSQFIFPGLMAVYNVINRSIAGCGAFTVGVYMSRDTDPTISPGDDLISLYRAQPFDRSGRQRAHMIAYDAPFMTNFYPYSGWTMKIAVDLEEEIDEADETNNVLVVDPDPANYSGPLLPRGLDPLPDPGPGGDPLRGEGAAATFNVSGTGPLGGGEPKTSIAVESLARDGLSPGLLHLAYRIENGTQTPIPIENLNIFAAHDLGLGADTEKPRRELIYSSALAGDARGDTTVPPTVQGPGMSAPISLALRIPGRFLHGRYKLIFVANAEVFETGPDLSPIGPDPGPGDIVVKRLVFTDQHAVELGYIDPNDLLEQ